MTRHASPAATALTDRTPLTAAQRGIWYAQHLDPSNPTFQIGQYLDLNGRVDASLLRIAVTKMVADIDALSLRIREDPDGPFAQIRRPHPTANLLHVRDLRELGPDRAEQDALAAMDRELSTPRALDGEELFGATLFRIAEDRALFFLRIHHILLDGYSAVIALRYVAETYTRISAMARYLPGARWPRPLAAGFAHVLSRIPSPLPSLPALLSDLEDYERSAQHTADATYWTEALAEAERPEGLEGRARGIATSVVRVGVPIGSERAKRLAALERALPKTVIAATAVYLARMTGSEEVPLGLPVTARRGRIAKTTPSMLSSILPLRVPVRRSDTLADVVTTAGDAVRAVVGHQRFRLEEIGSAPSHPGPSVNLLPVIDDLRLGAARGTVHILSTGPVQDFSIILSDLRSDAADPVLRLEGDAALHSTESLRRHGRRVLRLLDAMLDPTLDSPALTAPLLEDEEREALLSLGHGSPSPGAPGTVLDVVRETVHRRGAERAVVAEDGERSFAELEADSTRLARCLIQEGVEPGDQVAVRLGRTVRLPEIVLGILRAGAAYVPLDPAYPVGRVGHMLEDAAPSALLTTVDQQERDRRAGAEWEVPTLLVDSETAPWRRPSSPAPPLPPVGPEDLAYVIFTSGSTGRPKGVAVEHGPLHALLAQHRRTIHDPAVARLGRPLRAAHTAGLSFDASWDPLLWLFSGHELHIIEDEVRRDPERLVARLDGEHIDALETTPSFAEALLATGMLEQARYPTEIALGGEAVGEALWATLAARDDIHAVNLYGPTESTVDSLVAPIEEDRLPHLGSSVDGSRHYVLDAGLSPVPDRGIGELYLAGHGVARGYVGRPGLNAQRFVADPFAADGSRMYRTGDRVRRRADGTLRFLGRLDDQLKIRGYRVEIAEVESALRSHGSVTAAAAIVLGDGASARLIGYVATGSGHTDAEFATEVRDSLRDQLPEYMVPSTVIALERLPATANGKLDRSALPAPTTAIGRRDRAPRAGTEHVVGEAFRAVLEREAIGAEEDFFAAGGHSLLATRLAARLTDDLDRTVTVRDVFERPSVAALASTLEDSPGSRATTRPERRERPDPLPASLSQRRLWFLHRLDPDSAAYSVPVVLEIEGALDTAALRGALDHVLARHEPLRTVLPAVDGEPTQHILRAEEVPSPLLVVDVPVARLDAVVATETHRPFDITREIPLRAVLLRTTAQHAVLVITMHHTATDGWSLAPFARDLGVAYTARTAGHEAFPEPLTVDYADAAMWQRDRLGSADDPGSELSRQRDFWRHALADAPPEISLPRDRGRGAADPDDADQRGVGEIRLELDPRRHADLRSLAAEHRTSLFIVLHAALTTALHQHGTGDDVVIGTPVAGRGDPRLDDIVGFFVNTVALRTSLHGDPTLSALIERVRVANTEAYAHQELPFDAVVDAVRPPRQLDRPPVIQVLLTLQNAPTARLELPGVQVRVPAPTSSAGVKADLLIDVTPEDGDDGALRVALGYDRALFDRSTVERLRESLDRVLAQITADPEARLSDLPTAGPEELRRLEERGRGAEAPAPTTVLERLDRTAREQPGSPALLDARSALTSDELLDRVRALAAGLARNGVRRGDRVVIALPRSTDAVTVLLGVLRAGAVAVPVDSTHPDARLALVLAAAAANAVVTAEPARFEALLVAADEASATPVLTVEDLPAAGDVPPPPEPADTAYLVHTSGTTGAPKGVQVSHRALGAVMAQHEEALIGPLRERLGRAPRMLHLSGLAFDAAWDPVLWLVAGSTLHIADDSVHADADAVVGLVREERIDVLETTPSYAAQLMTVGLEDAVADGAGRLLLALGGESVPPSLWDRIAGSEVLDGWNLYGPSESTIDALSAPIVPGPVVIGDPVAGVRARVLDDLLRPVPPGVDGELYLSGVTLADGYRGRAGETAARFVADPAADGARMYRTGDIVRRSPRGGLRFLRRADDQVKLRGYRIETGDVESALERSPGVRGAVALVVAPGGPGTERIAAWVAGDVAADAVGETARRELPAYMVPTTISVLPQLPLTSNGKVDTAALPVAQREAAPGRGPADEAEERMCSLFADVLAISSAGPEDDFFALGGHSLLAVELVGRLRPEFGVTLPVRAVFDSATPAALLAAVRAGDPEHDRAAAEAERSVAPAPLHLREWVRQNPRTSDEDLPLSPDQARLWFLHQLDPDSSEYTVVLEADLEGDLDTEALGGSIDDLVARHEILRTTFPEIDGRPVQRIQDPPSGILGEGPLDVSAGFPLATEIPLRAGLVENGAGRWRLTLAVHHIATDGASLAPLVRDLASAYGARTGGMRSARRPLEVQFSDHARHQQALEAGRDRDHDPHLDAWSERLRGAPEELNLPADGRRTEAATRPARTVRFTLPEAVAHPLLATGTASGASGFHTWFAALASYLQRIGAGDDLVIGTPSAGRTDPDLHDLIGFFVTTLPVRVQVDGEQTFRDAVGRSREAVLHAMEHDGVPFERIVEALAPERQLGRHPVFQTMLSVDEASGSTLALPGVSVSRVEPDSTGAAKVDLSLTLRPREDGAVDGVLEYAADLFSEDSARGFVDRWVGFLEGIVADPGRSLQSIPAGPPAAPLEPWRAATGRQSVLAAVSASAVERPDATALVGEDGSLSAGELAAQVEALAGGLHAAGAHRGEHIALAVRRGTVSVTGLLAIWRAGAIAVPVDTTLPRPRMEAMLRTARPSWMLRTGDPTEDDAAQAALEAGLPVDRILRSAELPAAHASVGLPEDDDPAYVIFTSGTSGVPKGVQVPHRALTQLLRNHRSTLLPDPAQRRLRLAHTTGVGFDASLDPVLWLAAGHEVHILGDEVRRDPEALIGALARHRIDAWETTPSYVDALRGQTGLADLLDARDPADPFVLLLGGEPVDPALWSWVQQRRAVQGWNLYGPTEAGVDTLVAAVHESPVPVLGAPTCGTVARVLDARLRPVPVGSIGELWLAGDQLADGYLGDAAQSAARFVADPFGPAGSRMYRTGDLVAVRDAPSGHRARVVALGRGDDQVKIRGHRIEPGEVAAVLEGRPEVAQAVVRPTPSPRGTVLAAWVVPAEAGDGAGLPDLLGQVSAARLPEYMQPTAITVVDSIPLTTNGKVDVQALPGPAVGGGAGRAPREGAEAAVATAFAAVLGVHDVRADDSFFALGGHSFVARPVVAAIGDALGRDVPVHALFRAPTVAQLAVEAEGAPTRSPDDAAPARRESSDLEESLSPLLALRPDGQGNPLFAVHPASGLAWSFSGLLPHLRMPRPVWGLQMPGLSTDEPPDNGEQTLDDLLARYLETMRAVQPHGPYHLLGYSLGGRIAHHLAARLQAEGEDVALLAVLDAYPGSGRSLQGVEDEQARWRALLGAQEAPVPEGELDAARAVEALRAAGNPLGQLPVSTAERMASRFTRLGALLDAARTPVVEGDLTVFEATRDVPLDRPGPEAWIPHVTGEVAVRRIDARHADLLDEPAVRSVAADLDSVPIRAGSDQTTGASAPNLGRHSTTDGNGISS